MPVFYNELYAQTAAWLSRLAGEGQLPAGDVNTRSITNLTKKDVCEYGQCHFFAGIGGWPLALRWAGLEGVRGIWTGSPPCQPFSVAGKRLGERDERHLAPVWIDLIRQCPPPIVFGEQVAAAIRVGWLDDLFDAMGEQGYTCGAAVLPACSVGAPHKRDRIFFGAVRLADTNCELLQRQRANGVEARRQEPDVRSPGFCRGKRPAGNSDNKSGWGDLEWIGCRDGKIRPIEPGACPLANGISSRVGRLRGYGNAIVPQVAAVFVSSFIDAAKGMSA